MPGDRPAVRRSHSGRPYRGPSLGGRRIEVAADRSMVHGAPGSMFDSSGWIECVLDQLAKNVADRNVGFLDSLSRVGFDNQCQIADLGQFTAVLARQPHSLDPFSPSGGYCLQHVWRVPAGRDSKSHVALSSEGQQLSLEQVVE